MVWIYCFCVAKGMTRYMSKVMVIAGGAWQAPIIEKIKKMGHTVLCTNLYADTEGMLLADEKAVANVLDKDKNLEIAKSFNPEIIITDQSDIAVPTVAYVSEELGLPGIGTEKAQLFTNKYLMREFEKANGFIHPNYMLCECYEDAQKFLLENKKAIIKPLNSQSSRGVFVVQTEKDFKKEFEESLKYTNGFNNIIIEEYVEGTEFTVDGIKLGEEYQVLAISEKKHYEYNKSVANQLLFSNNNSKFNYDKLRRVNEALVKAMDLPFGLTHAEYKYRDGNFYLIEIAARGGGTLISSHIVPIMSGIDSNELLVRYMLGEKVNIPSKDENDRWAILKFLDIPSGKVKKINGLEKIKTNRNVVKMHLNFTEGSIIEKATDDSKRVGFYIAYAESQQDLIELMENIETTLDIEMEKINE